MEYNTRRPKLVIPEYGRHIQKMVDHAISIKDKEERNKAALSIINVMGQLNPHLRDVADFKHKLWDHLFVISDFKLDVGSPYDLPTRESVSVKAESLNYPDKKFKYKHYGKTIQEIIKKAIAYPEGDEKKALTIMIANHMKKSYLTWNKGSVEDEKITNDLKVLSDGLLALEDDQVLADTKGILINTNRKKRTNNNNNQKQRPYNKRKQQGRQ